MRKYFLPLFNLPFSAKTYQLIFTNYINSKKN